MARKNRPILYEVARGKKKSAPARPGGWSLFEGLVGRRSEPPESDPPAAPETSTAPEPPADQASPPKSAPAKQEPAPHHQAQFTPAKAAEPAPAPKIQAPPPSQRPAATGDAAPRDAVDGPQQPGAGESVSQSSEQRAPAASPPSAERPVPERTAPAPTFTPDELDAADGGDADDDDDLPTLPTPRPRTERHTIPPKVALRGEASRPPGAVARTGDGRALDNSQLWILGAGLIGLLLLAWLVGPLFSPKPADDANGPAAAAPPAKGQPADVREIFSQLTGAPPAPDGDSGRPGQRGGSGAAPENPAPATPPVAANPEKPGGAAANTPTVELKRGFHYVVVQHFPTRREDDAQAAARYLIERGLPCALFPGADIRLLLTESFLIEQDDAAASQTERKRADRLLARVRELGGEYRKGGGGYDFAGATVRQIK